VIEKGASVIRANLREGEVDVIELSPTRPGEETFLVGRFTYADGGIMNRPSARFGAISMNPGQPIRQEDGQEQDGFLVECHSIGGFSGSPVFVSLLGARTRKLVPALGHLPVYLLEVDWGHIPAKWNPVITQGGQKHTDWGIQENSGLMGVVPAWILKDFLFSEEIVKERKEADALIDKNSAALNTYP
jgi:hypothetical protein